ncbi:SCO family protein [Bradyrhizobium acaciae]|uniref:SCO family protein n=1 Tax=Bradyrhizobium acaciae TaxID=2683706 RepID=UPI001E469177|nr:SCO family protein [Bradyrhizobium acaciae]MCC8982961.1 SCO family protein [Bradyrhizobium acaciae]
MTRVRQDIFFIRSIWAGLFVALASTVPSAHAAFNQAQLEQVGITSHLGEQLPLVAPLSNEQDQIRPLKEWLQTTPTVWIIADYACSTLCGPLLSIVSNALADTGLRAGVDFRLVVLGLDPKDTAADARAMKAKQITARGEVSKHATFLRGTSASVGELLAAFGIRSSYDRERDQFAHPVAAFVVTPDGRISRALPGIAIDPGNLRLALVEAGRGHVGSWSDQAHLLCYGFDPATGIYTLAIWRVLTGAVTITTAALFALVAFLIRRGGASPKPG